MGYLEIRKFRDDKIGEAALDHFTLNQFHDQIMKLVICQSIKLNTDQYGPPPCPFSFIVMGSAGRFEQSVWSDQDHGMIYFEQSDEVKSYFWQLGKEISRGLYEAGYQYCDGGVMASNLLWCKSLEEWKIQVSTWISESSWESIRYLVIFMDARSIFGEEDYIKILKNQIYHSGNKVALMTKVLKNSLFLKKGINVLGKLLAETHGPYTGSLNMKETAIFPFVNAARLLAMKENRLETSTLERINGTLGTILTDKEKEYYQRHFIKLLNCRLVYGFHTDYHSGHYLPLGRLTKEEIREVKEIIKSGSSLFHSVRKILEKEDSYGNK